MSAPSPPSALRGNLTAVHFIVDQLLYMRDAMKKSNRPFVKLVCGDHYAPLGLRALAARNWSRASLFWFTFVKYA